MSRSTKFVITLISFSPVSSDTSSSAVSPISVGWDYSFPYGTNNTCECTTVPALGEFFTTEVDCLKAYAEDPYQWCTYEGIGIYDSQCDDVVAIAEGVTNDLCSSMCTSLVAGSITYAEFQESCKFNFYADFDTDVAVGWTSCFSNLVYGWSDYDPSNQVQEAPLRMFSNVEGPVQCQALCQAVDGCVYWTWRAYADQGTPTQAFQNPPLTCLLYDQDYIDGVLNTVMPTTDAFAVPTPYCNFPEIPECMVDIWNRESVPFLEPYSCLLCECVGKCAWKSPYHISGPAFCLPEYRDECSYSRPSWTSTLPPCDSDATEATTTTTIDIDATSTETTIELDDTTTDLDQTEVSFPETIGTSMTAVTQVAEVDSTEAASTGGTSTTTPPIDETESEATTKSDAAVTPVGSVETTTSVGSDMTMGTATTVTAQSVPLTELPAGSIDVITTGVALPSDSQLSAPAVSGQTAGSAGTQAPGVTCPDCPDVDCEEDAFVEDFADECIDC